MSEVIKEYVIKDYPEFVKRLDDFTKAYQKRSGNLVKDWDHTSKKLIIKHDDGSKALFRLEYVMSDAGKEYIVLASRKQNENRPIKFRFFSEIDGTMYKELSLISLNWKYDRNPAIYGPQQVFDGKEGGPRVQNYGDGCLEQFTGVCDANGVEIYEGDEIEFHLNKVRYVGVVIYFEGGFRIMLKQTLGIVAFDDKTFQHFIKYHVGIVIGNIHQMDKRYHVGKEK